MPRRNGKRRDARPEHNVWGQLEQELRREWALYQEQHRIEKERQRENLWATRFRNQYGRQAA